ncbi:MAG: phosphatidylserine decarboxylase [Sulfobacillus acidophilus]|uniref:phosphatidylserine decarboxylase n=1 Tax=Sulfobacillus acidophilus TaxID=53633 RepID=A0A2T2WG36_9FIRM|nr:MAG: phosphatidylserine decarboxylase [Sulfobacillus acidophilus]
MKAGPLAQWFPRGTVTRVVGWFARTRLSRLAVAIYVKRYGVDLSEAEKPMTEYRSLAEFFGRRLKAESRPIDDSDGAIVSPSDALLSEQGSIDGNVSLSAKGVRYSLSMLLAADGSTTSSFDQGWFMTLYLSPRDYHRVHVPVAGKIVGWTHVPGTFYPVNARGVTSIPAVFTRNERVIIYIATDAGTYAVVMVGAFVIGGISLVHVPQVITNRRPASVRSETLNHPIAVARGDELGQFNFGSTVILLFPGQFLEPNSQIATGSLLKMGVRLARRKGAPYGSPVAF